MTKSFFSLLISLIFTANALAQWTTIQNGKLWLDTEGRPVQAHAPGFVKMGDVWYMVGEDRSNPWNPDVNLYSSRDLVHWQFEKKIIENGVTTPQLGNTRMIERPKLMYNPQTQKFVVWCHYESKDYSASEAACFECDSVNGSYRFIWGGRPMGIKSRDCNVFQDTDGTAYFISTTVENQHLGLFQLSADYHEAVRHTELFTGQRREAPAIVRVGDTYFMFNSACSGWDPNPCKMSYTTDLTQGWIPLRQVGNSLAYDTQAAAILEIRGTKRTTYLYVGDRWQDPGLPESKTIIFPIEFDGHECRFDYHERFDINFTTGEWRETPTQDIFVDKKKWKKVTNDEYITIDLGRKQTIGGILVTPHFEASARDVVRRYDVSVSQDGQTWESVSHGRWLPYWTEVDFPPVDARWVRLQSRDGKIASVSDIDLVVGKK